MKIIKKVREISDKIDVRYKLYKKETLDKVEERGKCLEKINFFLLIFILAIETLWLGALFGGLGAKAAFEILLGMKPRSLYKN